MSLCGAGHSGEQVSPFLLPLASFGLSSLGESGELESIQRRAGVQVGAGAWGGEGAGAGLLQGRAGWGDTGTATYTLLQTSGWVADDGAGCFWQLSSKGSSPRLGLGRVQLGIRRVARTTLLFPEDLCSPAPCLAVPR